LEKAVCPAKEKIQEAITLGEKLLEESGMNTTGFQEYWYSSSVNEWTKEEKHRIYVNLKYGRTYSGQRKWVRGVTYCIDLSNGSVSDVSRDYNNASENGTIARIAQEIHDKLFV